MHAATSAGLAGVGGVYLDNCRVVGAHPPPEADAAAWLWERSAAHALLPE